MAGSFANQMDFELLGIGTVLKRNRLKVPLNQREYSWEDRHVEELFQDLAGAISSGKQAYFLGVLVLTNGSDGRLEIADGQQRLATTSILLAAIRDYFFQKNDTEMVADLQGFLRTFVRETRESDPVLRLNVTDHEFFSRRVLELPDHEARQNLAATQISHQLIDRAADIAEMHVGNILRPLSEPTKDDFLNRWINFLENSAQVIALKVPDDMNAYLMFETLNDRGLRVSQSDLVKNYLFSQADTRITEAQDRWSSMNGSLDVLNDDEATITFLRHLLISNYGPVRERDVLERVRSNVIGRVSAIQFLDTLSTAADDYVALHMPTSGRWTNYNIRIRRHIDDLLSLPVTPLRPLMLSVLRNFSARETEVSFGRFVSWSARWLTAGGGRSGGVETAIGTAAKRVTDSEVQTADKLTELLEPVLPNDSRFQLAFRNLTLTNHKMARYYLRTLESTYHGESEPEWVPNEETVITLEHVLPQRPGENWQGIEPAIHSTYYKRLGNMALLQSSSNSELGNAPFGEKRKVFSLSRYRLTKELSTEQVWGPTEIEKRQERLSELAVAAWPLQ